MISKVRRIIVFVFAVVLIFAFCVNSVSATVVDAPTTGQIFSNGVGKMYTPYTFGDIELLQFRDGVIGTRVTDDYFYLMFRVYLLNAGISADDITQDRLEYLYTNISVDVMRQGSFVLFCNLLRQSVFNMYENGDSTVRLYFDSLSLTYLDDIIQAYCDYYGLEGDYGLPFVGQELIDEWYTSVNVVYVRFNIYGNSTPICNTDDIIFLDYYENVEEESSDFSTWWNNFISSIDIGKLTSWLP